ncbi:Nicastrin [Balamuthia mandrillaris]
MKRYHRIDRRVAALASLCSFPLLFLALLLPTAAPAGGAYAPGPKYLYNQIYTHKGTPRPAVRLLHKTGEVGASAPEGGTVGFLHPVLSEEDLNKFVKDFKDTLIDHKAVVLASHLFNSTIVERLYDSNAVRGLLVLAPAQDEPLSSFTSCKQEPGKVGFSPASLHPNRQWGLHPNSNYTWNPCGDDWAFKKISFPMFVLNENDSEYFLEKAKINQKEDTWPKWAVEFNAFMWGAGDSETCLRREYCDPMGGQSVWATLEQNGHVDPQKPILLVMAQLDSTAMFHDLSIGAESHSSAIATLLTALDALAAYKRQQESQEREQDASSPVQVVVAFWTGEAWGYLGSKKFVQDIQGFKCEEADGQDACKHPLKNSLEFRNISLDRISAIIEIDQVALMSTSDPVLYVHREPDNPNQSLLSTLQSVSQTCNLTLRNAFETPFEIPPASLNSFLRANSSIPGVVLADYSTQYKNRFYHSRLDNYKNLFYDGANGTSSVCSVATFVARAIWKLSHPDTPDPPSQLLANCTVANAFLECLVSNNTCKWNTELLHLKKAPEPPSHYTGVFRWLKSIELTPKLLHESVSVLTSPQRYLPPDQQIACNTSKDCPSDQGMRCLMHVCMQAGRNVYYHDAFSPGLYYDYHKGRWKIVNPAEPLWTEPRWDTTGIRVFLADSIEKEIIVMLLGVLEFLSSLLLFWLAKRALAKRFSFLKTY